MLALAIANQKGGVGKTTLVNADDLTSPAHHSTIQSTK